MHTHVHMHTNESPFYTFSLIAHLAQRAVKLSPAWQGVLIQICLSTASCSGQLILHQSHQNCPIPALVMSIALIPEKKKIISPKKWMVAWKVLPDGQWGREYFKGRGFLRLHHSVPAFYAGSAWHIGATDSLLQNFHLDTELWERPDWTQVFNMVKGTAHLRWKTFSYSFMNSNI